MALHMDGKYMFKWSYSWEIVSRNAGGHITKEGTFLIFMMADLCFLIHALPQTEFCYNQLHPSETAKTITVLDVQGVGIRDLGTCLVVFMLSSFPPLRETLFSWLLSPLRETLFSWLLSK